MRDDGARPEMGRSLAELAEAGRLSGDGRWSAVAAGIRFGLAEARAVPLRRLSYAAWACLGGALAAWVLLLVHRGTPAPIFWPMLSVQAAWFCAAVFLGYVHLGLVRRDDGTPRRSFLVPNGLTLLRFTLAPMLGFTAAVAADLRPDAPLIFWPLVVVVASDLLDGQIARAFDLRSEWGRLADPLADIFAVTCMAVGLWVSGALEAWLALPIIIRYSGALIAAFAVWGAGMPVRIEATVIGKATNFAVSFTLPALLAGAMMWPSWADARWLEVLQYVAAALVYANMAYYVARLWHVAASGGR